MKTLSDLQKANIILSSFSKLDEVFISDEDFKKFDSEEYTFLPAFCDVHVHFREPGFSYKETIETGSKSAAKGGYTAVCTMPNLSPVPDSIENLKIQTDIIKKDSCISVYPYASITIAEKGEQLTDIPNLSKHVLAFTDDGKGVQDSNMMLTAMKLAKENDRIIAAHCEDNTLLFGGYIHDGKYAKEHGHKGISSASEFVQVERDLRLAKETGVKYHVCHISTKETVDLIRKAKADGVDVTCETGPHYLVMDDSHLIEDGRFKMNPPLRDALDRRALVEGIVDGTIDMIATDHAPHSKEEKSKGLKSSAFGVVGLETAFSVLYTGLVKKGVISLEKLVYLMSVSPRKRFNINDKCGYSVWKLEEEFVVNPDDFLSKGRATPFEGDKLFAQNYLTVLDGKTIYKR